MESVKLKNFFFLNLIQSIDQNLKEMNVLVKQFKSSLL